MKVFDFFKKKKDSSKQTTQTKSLDSVSSDSTSSILFSKNEMEDIISILTKISYIFRDSKLLCGGRNIIPQGFVVDFVPDRLEAVRKQLHRP